VFVRHIHDDGSWSLQHRGSRRWLRVESWGGLVTSSTPDLASAERFDVEVVSRGVDEVSRAARDADVVLVAVGNDPHINGRETEDRPSLDLPEAQQALVEAALAANPATVLTVVSSYPYALGDLAERLAAVVWSSHAGQELGHGLMDVLEGRVEPTGRVAQTWWADGPHAGEIFDYDIIDARMTWWYSPHTPLYALGHGLTYGAVEYLSLELPDGLDGAARVRVANRGTRPAHELVQVYAESADERVGRRMLGHARIALEPRAEATVEVALRPERLRIWSGPEAGLDLPATTWRVVAAPSAAMDGPEVTLQTGPQLPAGPSPLPLVAWHAPEWAGVVGVPVDTLRGTAYRARRGTGSLAWPDTEPLPARLALRVRVRGGHTGVVELLCGHAVATATPDTTQAGRWHDVTVDCPSPGAATLEVRLHGSVELAEIGAL
ncbi:MAG TPA: glycoside hydrolase family 3 C-terminal domain-containing protein, partial [Arachnia sp.]|nr:glycoside hydrolase family 3 C-terminal domain-containing protein [Arachnia sp.]